MVRKVPVELPEGYVEFYKDLETWQNETQVKLNKLYSRDEVDLNTILTNNEKSLIKIIDFTINKDTFENVYLEFLAFLDKARPSVSPLIKAISDNINLIDFENLANKVLDDDYAYFNKLSEDIGVSRDFLIFTVDHTMRPFLRAYAKPFNENIGEDDLQAWSNSGICPICSSKSNFCRLRASDGRRFMFCERCFTEWETRYLYCIHCTNDEPKTIKYFTVENDESYQLYICEKCNCYVKTYDERPSGREVDLFIANIETIYLDMLAEEKGYSNSPTTN
ncbi:Formate dehydrogenase formation protein FdhE [Candidatus Syntrophocurvum alkaliphilum]|uniref:Formate dehydrogenase formation protein FdhE n=1 Tax=Candidatus Syntrophocurvum alkaliphilum TaxID=2293317 RepID=A0A6I6DEF3_9FIRM|nr:formate dehydrogenase accessory protein FdhE [Candidatus Syntrophocurvum alkaliphilum]QGT99102.1 Formate dehydrogenase formation protein FdhE [Candidatus Syntrophocurvum alkaliphilum]